MAVFHAPCNMHVPRLFSVFDRQNSAMAALDPTGRGPTIDHRPSVHPGHRTCQSRQIAVPRNSC